MKKVSIEEVLSYISPSVAYNDGWLDIGMALHAGGYDISTWRSWSSGSSLYHAGDCEKHWNSFSDGGGIGIGTLIKMARDNGMPSDYILDDGASAFTPTRRSDTEPEPVPIDYDYGLTKSPLLYCGFYQLYKYIKVLYKPDDIIGFCTGLNTEQRDGKYNPHGGKKYKAGVILDKLINSRNITEAIGYTIPEAGAWAYLNTYDDRNEYGIDKFEEEDLRSFNYTLVESDKMTVSEQMTKYRELNLPIAVMTLSGGKSVHAIVRIDAGTYTPTGNEEEDKKRFETVKGEYERRVRKLHEYLKKHGVEIDTKTKNPNRMTRIPGVFRGNEEQALMAFDIGLESWDKFEKYLDSGEKKHEPLIVTYPMTIREKPAPDPEVITGLLKKGGKMEVSGASKSSKSFFLSELAIDLSIGGTFLKFKCVPSKTLYINLENTEKECDDRFYEIRMALKLPMNNDGMLGVITLTGKDYTLTDLVDQIIDELKNDWYEVIIIDPLYKVMEGDENKAEDMTRAMNQLDRLRVETRAAVIYAHHHSKGAQGGKDAQDRASGSGVTARDFDALIDKVKFETPEGYFRGTDYNDLAKGYRLEFVARSFAEPDPVNVIFDYPLHKIDDKHLLDSMTVRGTPEYEAKTKAQATDEWKTRQKEVTWNLRQQTIGRAWDRIGKERVKKSELVNMIFEGIDPETKIAEWAKSSWNAKLGEACEGKSDYRLEDGYVVKNVKN